MTLVSIIITAHNYGKYLRQAVDSAINQTHTDLEIIIVDDGSSDNTQEVLATYDDPRIRIIHHEVAQGLAASCHEAITSSKGNYVVRLDADDYFHLELVETLLNHLTKNDLDYVFPEGFEFDDDGNILREYHYKDPIGVLDENPLPAGSLHTRECYDKVGGYDPKLRRQEDFSFWVRLIKFAKIGRCPESLYYYRKHPGAMSTNFDRRMLARRQIKSEQVDIDPKKVAILVATDEKNDNTNIMKVVKDSASHALAHEMIVCQRSQVQEELNKRTEEVVVILDANYPYRKTSLIDEAIRTAYLFDVQKVVSVFELQPNSNYAPTGPVLKKNKEYEIIPSIVALYKKGVQENVSFVQVNPLEMTEVLSDETWDAEKSKEYFSDSLLF